jgi:hypothetical protein
MSIYDIRHGHVHHSFLHCMAKARLPNSAHIPREILHLQPVVAQLPRNNLQSHT